MYQQFDSMKYQMDLLNQQLQNLQHQYNQHAQQQQIQQPTPPIRNPIPVHNPMPVPQQVQSQPSMIDQINSFASSILTPDQINWLSDPTILSGVPLFLKSEKGKQAVQLLLEEYQSYVNR